MIKERARAEGHVGALRENGVILVAENHGAVEKRERLYWRLIA